MRSQRIKKSNQFEPPSLEELSKRLSSRATESSKEIKHRLSNAVRETIKNYSLPSGLEVSVFSDFSKNVRTRLDTVKSSGVIGLTLLLLSQLTLYFLGLLRPSILLDYFDYWPITILPILMTLILRRSYFYEIFRNTVITFLIIIVLIFSLGHLFDAKFLSTYQFDGFFENKDLSVDELAILSAPSFIGVSGFLTSCAIFRATSDQAANFCALIKSVISSKVNT